MSNNEEERKDGKRRPRHLTWLSPLGGQVLAEKDKERPDGDVDFELKIPRLTEALRLHLE